MSATKAHPGREQKAAPHTRSPKSNAHAAPALGERAHADATVSAESVGARASTVGRHVVFGAGEYNPATAKPEDLRVHSYEHVRETLKKLGLDCCKGTPEQGETESAVDKLKEALRKGKMPKK